MPHLIEKGFHPMKKINSMPAFIILVSIFLLLPADAHAKMFQGKGEVVTVDPVYGRVTIQHGPIAGLAGDEETEFFVTSPDLLKNLGKRDLVDFEITEEKGETKINKITKTGIAPEEDDRLPLGNAVQGALETTGEVAKTVTEPIAPAHEVVKGATDTTTSATKSLLKDQSNEVKQKF